MVAVIDELEELGLAERRPHPADRRKHAVHLTGSGRRMLARAREVAARTVSHCIPIEPRGTLKFRSRALRVERAEQVFDQDGIELLTLDKDGRISGFSAFIRDSAAFDEFFG